MKHRGKHPNDEKLFSPDEQIKIREAVKDLSFLYERDYAEKSASELVSNRYKLNKRQKMALKSMACSHKTMELRASKQTAPNELEGKEVFIDGYNILITLEVALSKGFLFECMDGCYRDLASVHGTYKKIEETQKALLLIGHTLKDLGVVKVNWFFDAPVSNSGKLKTMMRKLAAKNSFDWEIELVNNPDKKLIELDGITFSNDSFVLDNISQWFNIVRFIVEAYIPEPEIVHFF